jgi:1,4-alpha-glucan branching enzyme
MLRDPLLQDRYTRNLDDLIALADKEIHRTHWDHAYRELAWMYHHRFIVRNTYVARGDLVDAFREFQTSGGWKSSPRPPPRPLLLLANHPPAVHGKFSSRDHYRTCFDDDRGHLVTGGATSEGVEASLQEANLRWFILTRTGCFTRPRPRYGVFAPVFTPNGIAAFDAISIVALV